MTDIVLPPALRVARSSFRYIDNTGVARGAYTGVTQTTSLGGDRVGASLEFTPHGGRQSSERSLQAQLQSFLMLMRGRQNRVYLLDRGYAPRGTWPTVVGGELFSNADFSNGTTGWSTTGSKFTLSAADGVMRVKVNATGASALSLYQSVTTTLNSPHVIRGLVRPGRGSWATSVIYRYLDFSAYASFTNAAGYGVDTATAQNSSGNAGLYDQSSSGFVAGDFFSVDFMSASRCMLADGGGNLLLRSDEFDNAAWTKTRVTATANSASAPDGTSTMDGITEDTSNNTHFVTQNVTVTSPAQDVEFSVVAVAAGRNFLQLQLQEGTGNTIVGQYFSLSGSGAVGSSGSTGANWSNRRAFVTDLGNGRILCTMIARKTNAATTISATVLMASGDGTNSYLGNGSNAIALWRATVWPTSVPSMLMQSSSTTTASTTQSSSALYVKGLPVSQIGLLVPGDWVEIDSQLKMVTASLDSDAAGLGYLQFSPPLRRAVSDNTPVIVTRPMGRFILTSESAGWNNEPGIFSNASLEFEEAFA